MADLTLDELRARLHPTGDDGEWFARDELALMVEGIDAAIKQREQEAALYQELLMAVSKKFPNESRHETALRYIKQTELQSCEPKCDAAMAKESGNE